MASEHHVIVKQWRLCGSDPKRGDWWGTWREGVPSKNEAYDARQIALRNDRVWWEFRTVTYGPVEREDVQR